MKANHSEDQKSQSLKLPRSRSQNGCMGLVLKRKIMKDPRCLLRHGLPAKLVCEVLWQRSFRFVLKDNWRKAEPHPVIRKKLRNWKDRHD